MSIERAAEQIRESMDQLAYQFSEQWVIDHADQLAHLRALISEWCQEGLAQERGRASSPEAYELPDGLDGEPIPDYEPDPSGHLADHHSTYQENSNWRQLP